MCVFAVSFFMFFFSILKSVSVYFWVERKVKSLKQKGKSLWLGRTIELLVESPYFTDEGTKNWKFSKIKYIQGHGAYLWHSQNLGKNVCQVFLKYYIVFLSDNEESQLQTEDFGEAYNIQINNSYFPTKKKQPNKQNMYLLSQNNLNAFYLDTFSPMSGSLTFLFFNAGYKQVYCIYAEFQYWYNEEIKMNISDIIFIADSKQIVW